MRRCAKTLSDDHSALKKKTDIKVWHEGTCLSGKGEIQVRGKDEEKDRRQEKREGEGGR